MKSISVYSNLDSYVIEEVFKTYSELQYEYTSVNAKEKDIFNALMNNTADILFVSKNELPYPLQTGIEVVTVLKTTADYDLSDSQSNLIVGIAKVDRSDLKNIFQEFDIRRKYGKVTLVGFGPGSADLLTIAGEKALQLADTIFHDDLLDKEYLKKYNSKLINVGKRKGKHSAEQDKINQFVLEEAHKGRNVVRLKGGDPMIFGHGGEELEFLASNFVEATVIPGITTALALASYSQIPLTHRGISSSVAIISGHAAQIQLPNADTVICYMAGYNIPNIAAKAIADGRNPQTPVLLVHNVSLPDQQEFFYTLETLSIETRPFPTPIITIIGNVVGLRNKPEKDLVKPLYLYTGLGYTADNKENVRVVKQSLFELTELDDKTELESEIDQLKSYDWIVFTSKYAVQFFFQELKNKGKDTRSLCSLKIASMGESTTKALNEKGIFPDLEPQEQSSYELVQSFKLLKQKSGKILIPRSEKAQPIIPKGLTNIGWEVKSVIAYQNRMPAGLKPLDLTQFAGVIFASPSCVDNFINLYGELPVNKEIITRGRVTHEKVNSLICKSKVNNNTSSALV